MACTCELIHARRIQRFRITIPVTLLSISSHDRRWPHDWGRRHWIRILPRWMKSMAGYARHRLRLGQLLSRFISTRCSPPLVRILSCPGQSWPERQWRQHPYLTEDPSNCFRRPGSLSKPILCALNVEKQVFIPIFLCGHAGMRLDGMSNWMYQSYAAYHVATCST